MSYKSWTILVKHDLQPFMHCVTTIEHLIREIKNQCYEDTNKLQYIDFLDKSIDKINNINTQSILNRKENTLPGLITSTEISNILEIMNSENTIHINNNNTTPIEYTKTKYSELIIKLVDRLSSITTEISSDQTIKINLTSFIAIINSMKHAINEIENLNSYLQFIISNPEEFEINDFISYDTFQEKFNMIMDNLQSNELLPFGFNKYNLMQFTDIKTTLIGQTIHINITFPIITPTVGKSDLFEIISLPVQLKNGTFQIKSASRYGIFVESNFTFIPIYEEEFQKCKVTPFLIICNP